MNLNGTPTKLYNVGINYKKADVKVRGTFSITKENQKLLLEDAKKNGIQGLFVVSTCNRTEITGFAKHPFELISYIIKYSNGSLEEFIKVSNVYKNKDAVNHLFNIGTGLDSQILGDYEIVGQLKKSFKQANKVGTTNTYLERLMDHVIQASKEVKNNTKLSSGTTSVAYAAVQYIVDKIPNHDTKKILNFGLGDIGKNTCKNILKYTSNKNVTLINRTFEKAVEFKETHPNISINEYASLKEQINESDILIVSTGANLPTINHTHIPKNRPLLILDLSMPENVDPAVKNIEGVTLVNVDELSKITDKTIETRRKEIPKAEKIIDTYKNDFNEWIASRKYVPAVNALKVSLQTIQKDVINHQSKKLDGINPDHVEIITSKVIQKITTQFVKHLKQDDTAADVSIDVISKIFNLEELSYIEND